jgi:hypothetical protein
MVATLAADTLPLLLVVDPTASLEATEFGDLQYLKVKNLFIYARGDNSDGWCCVQP